MNLSERRPETSLNRFQISSLFLHFFILGSTEKIDCPVVLFFFKGCFD